MRIVIFSDTYPPEINGVATSSGNLFMTLKAHGQEVIALTTNPFDNEFSFEKGVMRIPGIYAKKLYGYRIAGLWNGQAMKILRDFHPDVIHIQTDGGIGQFGFLASSQLHAATVYTYHTMIEDYTYYATRGHFDRIARGIVRSYTRYKSHEAEEFITPSEKILEYMRSIGVDSYINVIPTGIDFGKFDRTRLDGKKIAALRAKFGLDPKAYVVLSLGRIAKEKSIDVCLRGYANFVQEFPKDTSRFLIVGGGPALEDLKALALSLGLGSRVIFTGAVKPDETPYYYALGNCFVSASTTETQGLTFMEAMASSLVLLARYDESLVGTIHDGENGFFFLDEKDFSAKLAGIISLSAPTLKGVLQAASDSIEPYSLERFYTRVMEVYKRAVKKNW
jgi:1,2-diacylglycerol 3-alpha-glucosyltransferase